MIDALIRWSLRNRTAVMALAAALLAWGGYAISTVPLDVLPDLTAPTVTILVEGRGMAPTEMEPWGVAGVARASVQRERARVVVKDAELVAPRGVPLVARALEQRRRYRGGRRGHLGRIQLGRGYLPRPAGCNREAQPSRLVVAAQGQPALLGAYVFHHGRNHVH